MPVLNRDRGQVLMSIGLIIGEHKLFDLAQQIAFLDRESNWSYRPSDETSQFYSSTEWKVGEIRRVFDIY
jgi:hypothetical protein